ncbi:hypothetical protein K7711_03090 [Nocardia sp. CA2R105]|uniref:hypothetical protein n=1 Tax=Nocardia coffeae TaxID=2873381 RepID=UPI001CA73478|nr:hypothetical protein [Nocardia coffeae]MBY8855453.1 hypothetical protein [Nocardia coffeae]
MAEKQMSASGSPRRAGVVSRASRRLAAVAAVIGVGASAPMLLGSGTAAASTLVPCTYGPIGSRLEVDCTDNDYTPATVTINAFCTNFANISMPPTRMGPRSRMHFTRDCGPGANPIFWLVNGESDWEKVQDQLDQMRQDQQDRADHHHHDDH